MANNTSLLDIEFRDLKKQYEHIKDSIDGQIKSIIDSSRFVSGPEIKVLEKQLSSFIGVKNCISCANGTDAISIALIAHGIGGRCGGGKKDAVFVPDFTFFSSGESPATIGAVPIFVDVDRTTYNIDAVSLRGAIRKVIEEDELKPSAVIAVDLFGQPADYEALREICREYGLLLLEDSAQGFGGSYTFSTGEKRMACALGDIATTSFFPAKPLGCYGDGGAIFTDDDAIADICRSIAVHGKDTENLDQNAKYNNIRLGMNSRLDTLQAGILLAKFSVFCNEELSAVNHVAEKYFQLLSRIDNLILPIVERGNYSSWAQYTVQLPENVNRENLQIQLQEAGIPTNIYYVKPMHKQKAFEGTRSSIADCPVTEELCKRVICLPIHPYLEDKEIEYICSVFRDLVVREKSEHANSI